MRKSAIFGFIVFCAFRTTQAQQVPEWQQVFVSDPVWGRTWVFQDEQAGILYSGSPRSMVAISSGNQKFIFYRGESSLSGRSATEVLKVKKALGKLIVLGSLELESELPNSRFSATPVFTLTAAGRFASFGNYLNNVVYDAYTWRDSLWIAGAFTGITNGPAEPRYLAVFHVSDSTWRSVPVSVNRPARALVATASGLLIAGEFTTASGKPVPGCLRWNGSTIEAVGQQLSVARYEELHVFRDTVYARGTFQFSNNGSIFELIRLENNRWQPVPGTAGASVRSIATSASRLWVAGTFPGKRELAFYDGVLQFPEAQPNGVVLDLHASPFHDTLRIAGAFTSVGSIEMHELAGYVHSTPFSISPFSLSPLELAKVKATPSQSGFSDIKMSASATYLSATVHIAHGGSLVRKLIPSDVNRVGDFSASTGAVQLLAYTDYTSAPVLFKVEGNSLVYQETINPPERNVFFSETQFMEDGTLFWYHGNEYDEFATKPIYQTRKNGRWTVGPTGQRIDVTSSGKTVRKALLLGVFLHYNGSIIAFVRADRFQNKDVSRFGLLIDDRSGNYTHIPLTLDGFVDPRQVRFFYWQNNGLLMNVREDFYTGTGVRTQSRNFLVNTETKTVAPAGVNVPVIDDIKQSWHIQDGFIYLLKNTLVVNKNGVEVTYDLAPDSLAIDRIALFPPNRIAVAHPAFEGTITWFDKFLSKKYLIGTLPGISFAFPPTNTAPQEAPASRELRLSASPNPFNPSTAIQWNQLEEGFARLAVYDLNGRLVQVVHEGRMAAGAHTASLNAGGLSSGVYLLRLETAGQVTTRKMTLLK